MVTQITKWYSEATGKEYATKQEAELAEAQQSAEQLLKDRCGIDWEQAEDVIRCIQQNFDMFAPMLNNYQSNSYSLIKGPLRVIITGPSGSGKGLLVNILHEVLGATHDITCPTSPENHEALDIVLKREE